MTSVNFAEMYLVPRDIYLRVLDNTNKDNLDPFFHSSSTVTTGKPFTAPIYPLPNNESGHHNNNIINNPTPPPSSTTTDSSPTPPPSLPGSNSSSAPFHSPAAAPSQGGPSGAASNDYFTDDSSVQNMDTSNLSRENLSKINSPQEDWSAYFGKVFTGWRENNKKKSETSSKKSSTPPLPTSSIRRPVSEYPAFEEKFAKQKIDKTPSSSSKSSKKSTESEKNLGARPKTSKKEAHPPSKKSSSNSSKTGYPSVPPEFAREKVGNIPSSKKSSNNSSVKRKKASEQDEVNALINKILNSHSPYDILGVESNWIERSLNSKLKKIRAQLHPDKCDHPYAKEAFQKASTAYNDLQDIRRTEMEREKQSRSSGLGGDQVFNPFTGEKSFRPPPTRRGPPTTTYPPPSGRFQPYRKPPSSKRFQEDYIKPGGKRFQQGFGIKKKWLKL